MKAGDVLIELDPTVNAAERDHLHDDLVAERLNIARLRAALASDERTIADLVAPADADPVAGRRPSASFCPTRSPSTAPRSPRSTRQQAQKQAEHETIAATIHKLEALIPVIQQRVDIRKIADGEGDRLEADLLRDPAAARRAAGGAERAEEPSARGGSRGRRDPGDARAGGRRVQHGLSDDLAKSEQKANGLAQDLIKAQQKTRLQQLTSPVDGVVQQLAVHTVGGVVTPAQSLLVIVPNDSQLEIEAMVSNRDIGFVQPGQDAEIKIDTFNFTRYGLLHGEVLSVSQDAIIRDKPDGARRASARSARSTRPASRTARS